MIRGWYYRLGLDVKVYVFCGGWGAGGWDVSEVVAQGGELFGVFGKHMVGFDDVLI